MNKSKLNNLIKEELSLNNIIDFLIYNEYKLNQKYSNNLRYSFYKENNKIDSSIDIYIDENPNFKFYVACNSKIIIDKQSLSDQSKNFITTSAEKIKYRTLNNREYFNDIDLVNKFIQKYILKISKLVG